jgi:hypothetical protein
MQPYDIAISGYGKSYPVAPHPDLYGIVTITLPSVSSQLKVQPRLGASF